MRQARILSILSIAGGLALLSWLLYDASAVVAALAPLGDFNEAIVAVAGLGTVFALFATAFRLELADRRRETGAARS
ncbi:hypothetical protein FBQ97_11075 [Acidobacteria bacterium ACD]|nr:MAG: hypothetical protein EDX89_23665 [Acidobacteriota bacterium]MCE7957307.1 hypothetical protein [Acidobacteria bacterium ACB2]MDL1950342.1 hypothetical protein [Acidobacteria bacterium ACD]